MNLFKTISLLSIILVTLILIFFIFTLQIKINQNERFYRLDLNGNGFPDVAELDYDDSENFRNWFTSIILNVVVNHSTILPESYSDCAGLVRYAYKEALKKHDPIWIEQSSYKGIVFEDVQNYNYPNVPALKQFLFKINNNKYSYDEISADFSVFASARHILEYNTVFVSKDIYAAKSGDVIGFFHPEDPEFPYHIMVYLRNNTESYILYHTGPVDERGGELRIVRLEDMFFADPSWLPSYQNKYFMGVFRFKILSY
jgi:hypothetical protein